LSARWRAKGKRVALGRTEVVWSKRRREKPNLQGWGHRGGKKVTAGSNAKERFAEKNKGEEGGIHAGRKGNV